MKKRILISDIDNTLFDWFTMWHRSFGKMAEKVSEITGISLEELYCHIKKIHQRHGTAEYAFLLEDLILIINNQYARSLSIDDLLPAIQAYRQAREQNMILYPGVEDTLKKIKNKGLIIIAFSESKRYYSSYRIRKLGLDGIVHTIYCPEDHVLPESRESTYPLSFTECRVLHGNFKKPNPDILLKILRDFGFAREDALYVGDSKSKDIKMAIEAKVDYLWFETGSTHLNARTEDYELLKKVTHWTEAEVEAERVLASNAKTLNIPQSRVIQDYPDILIHI